MDYHDEKLVALKLKKHALKHTDIKKDGIYVNDEFIKFQLTEVIEDIALYLPETFIEMPEDIAVIKYPSSNRPQIIKTSLKTDVNFTFNLFPEVISQEEAQAYITLQKEMIKKTNPAFRFIEEREGMTQQERTVVMFDFISYGLDDQFYNMMCLVPLHCGALQMNFNCLDRDCEEWKEAVWQAFLTIEEVV